MSDVVAFRASADLNADRVIEQMWSIVEQQDTLTGINACLHTLAALIAGYGVMHGEGDVVAGRCADLLKTMVADLAADLK